MSIKIYVEGGGDSNALRTKCREGFRRFFQNAGLSGRMPRVVACGSRNDAYDSFQTAIASAESAELTLLLVDAEDQITDIPWKHLQGRDGWAKPDGAEDKHAHLMVQCMEAWFLADRDCIQEYFGQGFHTNALPSEQQVEKIAKTTVLQSLENATRRCSPKGKYSKGRHSFDILGKLDPPKVRSAAPYADRLLELLESA